MLNAYELDANDKKVFLIDPMEQAQARTVLQGVLGRQPRDQEVVDYLNRRGILYP